METAYTTIDWRDIGWVTTDMLPDVPHFYVDKAEQIEAWHTLVHVCVKHGERLFLGHHIA